MSKLLFTSLAIITLLLTTVSTNSIYAQKHTNKLINESSPYLLQHAHNPVNWYPWGDEALKKAKAENKLILVSIGYSACHWCHVMEEESFSDEYVADFMNKNFVCIKVDREERPDIDDIYMTACQVASGGNCGWPLNALSLPDGRPFWSGTYFPREKWMSILTNILNMRATDPQKIERFAQNITKGVKTKEMVKLNLESRTAFQKSGLDGMYVNFMKATDFQNGGRKGKLKFPMPNNWMFLLEYYNTYGTQKALDAVTITLDKMAKGGIYDQLGGGFSRYSTDPFWKVPHFEKMLYDNAQLVSLYSEAYKVNQNPYYKDIVYETLGFVKRELTAGNGGFYSSVDADSEGEEGTYYVWTKAEIEELLTDKVKQISKYEWLRAGEVFCFYYGITETGNWEEGKNILFRHKKASDAGARFGINLDQVNKVIEDGRKELLAARNKRTRPKTDDKILTSWNALMIKGYVDAYEAFDEPIFLDAALKNARFLMENAIQDDNRLNRNYKDGKSSINAFLDDYALLAEAFIELYQATFNEKWLLKAKDLMDYTNDHFYDNVSSKMYYYTSDLDPELVARRMEINDNVIPGSNSIIGKNLYKLGTYLYDKDYMRKSNTLLNNVQKTIRSTTQPYFYSNWCSLYNLFVNPPYEIAIVGDNYKSIKSEIAKSSLPNALLLGGSNEGSLQLLKDKHVSGSTMVYVCKKKICKVPVESAEEAVAQIKKGLKGN